MASEFIEEAAAQALRGAPETSPLCAGRIYPVRLPHGTELPAATYRRVQTRPAGSFAGDVSEEVVLKITSVAVAYEEAKRLARAVRMVMASQVGAVLRDEKDVDNDNDSDAYCVCAEYLCRQGWG